MSSGPMTFDALKKAVKAGNIDTIIAAFPDMFGRLMGKRFEANFFVDGAYEETHGCNYLLAVDVDMVGGSSDRFHAAGVAHLGPS